MADEKSVPPAEGEGSAPPPEGTKEQEGGQQPPAGEPKKEEGQNGVPESYADFKLPEGLTLDAALNTEFKGVAKALGLSQEKAQQVVDLYSKNLKAQAEGQAAEFQKLHEGWKAETLKALGADSEKQLAFAAKAREKFGNDEFTKFMDETKMGEHPEVVQFMVRVGKAISEDSLVEGKNGTEEKSHAERIYGAAKK